MNGRLKAKASWLFWNRPPEEWRAVESIKADDLRSFALRVEEFGQPDEIEIYHSDKMVPPDVSKAAGVR